MPVELKDLRNVSLRRPSSSRDRRTPPVPLPPGGGQRMRGPASGPPPLPQTPLMRAFNLLPRETKETRAGGRPSPIQLLAAVLGGLLIAVVAILYLAASASVADKQQTVEEKQTELAAREARTNRSQGQRVDPALVQERAARTTALATALERRIAWDRLMRDFSLVLPEDVWLTGMTGGAGDGGTVPAPGVPTGGDSFLVTGYTESQEAVARLLARLSVLPELSDVSLVSSTSTEVADRRVVQFSITARLKTEAGA